MKSFALENQLAKSAEVREMICAFRRLLLTNEYRFAAPPHAISKEDRVRT